MAAAGIARQQVPFKKIAFVFGNRRRLPFTQFDR